MRILLFGLFLLASLRPVVRAEESKPVPTVEQLQIEVEALKNELAQLRMSMSFESRICNAAMQAAREFVTKPPAANPTPQRIPPGRPQNGAAPKVGSQP